MKKIIEEKKFKKVLEDIYIVIKTPKGMITASPMAYHGLLKSIKKTVALAGIDGKGIGIYSNHAGMSQDMQSKDVGLTVLQGHERWKSATMPARYTQKIRSKENLKWMPDK